MHSRYSVRLWTIWILLLGCATAQATSSNIKFALTCPDPGSAGGGAATVPSPGASSIQATCQQTPTGYTKLKLDTDSLDSTTLGYLDPAFRQRGELFSFGIPGFLLIVPPFGEPNSPLYSKTPIYTVESACPTGGTKTLNWIYVQFANGTNRLTGTKLLGYAVYDKNAESQGRGITVKGQWDLDGSPYFLGNVYIPGSCNQTTGEYIAVGNSPNTSGQIFFNSNGLGIFKTSPGSAIFFLPESSVSSANLVSQFASQTYLGTTFNSISEDSVRQVRAVSSADGRTFTVRPYSDPESGDLDDTASAYKDVIYVKDEPQLATNYPRNGFFLATVARVVDGDVEGYGDLACMGHYSAATGSTLFCTGTHPVDNAYPFTIAINSPRTTPAAPLSFEALPGRPNGSVHLIWADGSNNETGFELQISTNGTTWSALASPAMDSTLHVAQGLTPGATYQFRIRAKGKTGPSEWVTEPGTARNTATLPPGPQYPTNLAATPISKTQINLTWTHSGGSFADVLRSEDGLNWETLVTLVADVSIGSQSFFASIGLASGTKYYYRVLAHDGAASTSYSNTASTLTFGAPFSRPSPVSATAIAAGIRTNWTLNTSTHSQVVVERSLYGGSQWIPVANLSPSALTHLDGSAFGGARYYYRVKAVFADGNRTPYSDVVDAVSITAYNYAAHRSQILADDPLAYFNFDAASGNFVQDLTSRHFIGFLLGSTAFAPANAVVPVQKKTVFTGGYLSVNDDSRFRMTTFSLEAWFRIGGPSGNGTFNTLISKGQLNGLGKDENYQMMVHNSSGKVVGRIGTGLTGTNPEVTSTTAVNDGEWHHAVFTVSFHLPSFTTTAKIYVDGALEATGVWSGRPNSTATGPFELGTWRTPSLYGTLNGDIGEAVVYDYALTPAQVQDHFEFQ